MRSFQNMDGAKENHHVHFERNKDTDNKVNDIIIRKKDNKFDVHLGFLQFNHKYRVNFSIPRNLCQPSYDGQILVDFQTVKPHLQIINASVSQEALNFQLELFAYKEKLMVEEFTFHVGNDGEIHRVSLNARVLGKGKGTPLLKNDIHIIEVPVDSDSSSD